MMLSRIVWCSGRWGKSRERSLFPEDQLQAPGRPVFNETLLDHIRLFGGKGRGCGRAFGQAGKMNLGDCPAIGSAVKVVVRQEKGGGVGKVGIAIELVLYLHFDNLCCGCWLCWSCWSGC